MRGLGDRSLPRPVGETGRRSVGNGKERLRDYAGFPESQKRGVHMTEAEAIAKIHSVYPSGKKEGLTNMREIMSRLGNVQAAVPMVHVAGTNGKGSCCAMIERVLREAGYQTGLYTSPYIERYNERIRIGGVPIDGDRLAALVEQEKAKLEVTRDKLAKLDARSDDLKNM